jgi:hypothetical protein
MELGACTLFLFHIFQQRKEKDFLICCRGTVWSTGAVNFSAMSRQENKYDFFGADNFFDQVVLSS